MKNRQKVVDVLSFRKETPRPVSIKGGSEIKLDCTKHLDFLTPALLKDVWYYVTTFTLRTTLYI